jgi:ferrous iron transport protein B
MVAHWSLATALAILAWYVFAPQCASTLVVVQRETNSWRWPLVLFAPLRLHDRPAYGAAFIVYHAASALGG